MPNFKLTIAYDGTNFHGWQKQPRKLTIQEVLEKNLATVLGEKIKTITASRTDAGVHAQGQVVNFKTAKAIPPVNLQNALNSLLPEAIVVQKVVVVPDSFHARFDAKSKLYRYTVLNHRTRSPFYNRHVYIYSYPLSLSKMKEAGQLLQGKHDFAAFAASGHGRENTIRTISRLEVKKRGRLILFDLEADGFLFHMVRIIVGTLLEIGRGKLSPSECRHILSSHNRCLAGPTAPAKGLCLIKVQY